MARRQEKSPAQLTEQIGTDCDGTVLVGAPSERDALPESPGAAAGAVTAFRDPGEVLQKGPRGQPAAPGSRWHKWLAGGQGDSPRQGTGEGTRWPWQSPGGCELWGRRLWGDNGDNGDSE